MFVSNLTRMPPKDSVNLGINHEANELGGKSSYSGRLQTEGNTWMAAFLCQQHPAPAVGDCCVCPAQPAGQRRPTERWVQHAAKDFHAVSRGYTENLESATN